MSIETIRELDRWAEFVRVTQQARMRNAGLSRTTPVAISRQTHMQKQVPTGYSFNQTSYARSGTQGISISNPAQSSKTETLGSRFDAYA
jgi:hypothetical protein